MVPHGSSMVKAALKYGGVNRKGLRWGIAFIIRLFLSTNKASMVNRINRVWMELQGFNIRPSPALSLDLFNRPIIRLKGLSATTALSANTVPLLILIILIMLRGLEDICGKGNTSPADVFQEGGNVTRGLKSA